MEQAHIASREGGALPLTPHARGGVMAEDPPETRGQTLRALDFTPHFAAFSRVKSSFGAT